MKGNSLVKSLIKSTLIMGSSSVSNIIFGIIRMKAAALVLGPVGVGAIGLLQNALMFASVFFSMGMDTAGTQRVSKQQVENGDASSAIFAIILITPILAAFGAVTYLISYKVIDVWLFGDSSLDGIDIQWVALGIFCSIGSLGSVGILNGLRKVPYLAAQKIVASALTTFVCLMALLFLNANQAVVVFAISLPITMLMMGVFFLYRIRALRGAREVHFNETLREAPKLVSLGSKFMLGAATGLAGHFLVRSAVLTHLDETNLGYFEAAWTISLTYIGFLLGAMVTEYYPRLTAVVENDEQVDHLVNTQTQLAINLVGPVLVIGMGFAPVIISLLYSKGFNAASELFRLLVLGDLVKTCAWPIAFILMSQGRGFAFFLAEFAGACVFVGASHLFLNVSGLSGVGYAYISMYLFYFPIVFLLAKQKTNFRFSADTLIGISITATMLIFTYLIGSETELAGMIAALICFGLLSIKAYKFLTSTRA